MKTQLSETLDSAAAKVQYNAYCKAILSHRIILAWILKNTTEEFRECSLEEIAEKYIEGEPEVSAVPILLGRKEEIIQGEKTVDDVPGEGEFTYDIRFQVITPDYLGRIRIYMNLEAQKSYYPGYSLVKRGIFYCARMLSGQYGKEFTGKDYNGLKKVYSIWVCMNVPKKLENTIVSYHIEPTILEGAEIGSFISEYDMLNVIQIRLGDVNGTENILLKMLGTLFSTKIETKKKEEILYIEYGLLMDDGLEKEMEEMCNVADWVEEQGMERGIETSLRNLMLNMKMTVEQAMTALGIPDAEREKYAAMINSK